MQEKIFTKSTQTHCYVKSRRINNAEMIIRVRVCVRAQREEKQHLAEIKTLMYVLRSTMCTEEKTTHTHKTNLFIRTDSHG